MYMNKVENKDFANFKEVIMKDVSQDKFFVIEV